MIVPNDDDYSGAKETCFEDFDALDLHDHDNLYSERCRAARFQLRLHAPGGVV